MLRMNVHFYRVGRTTAQQVHDFAPKGETELRVMDGRTDSQVERILPAGLFFYSHLRISYNESMCAFSVVSKCLRSPWTIAHQAPLSMGFSRQEYWSGVPLPSPTILNRSGENGHPYLLSSQMLEQSPQGNRAAFRTAARTTVGQLATEVHASF